MTTKGSFKLHLEADDFAAYHRVPKRLANPRQPLTLNTICEFFMHSLMGIGLLACGLSFIGAL